MKVGIARCALWKLMTPRVELGNSDIKKLESSLRTSVQLIWVGQHVPAGGRCDTRISTWVSLASLYLEILGARGNRYFRKSECSEKARASQLVSYLRSVMRFRLCREAINVDILFGPVFQHANHVKAHHLADSLYYDRGVALKNLKNFLTLLSASLTHGDRTRQVPDAPIRNCFIVGKHPLLSHITIAPY